jgi:hypothetical protein
VARVLRLNDGQFLLGEQTLELEGLLERYRAEPAIVVRTSEAEVLVVRNVVDVVGVSVAEVLQVGTGADRDLVAWLRFQAASRAAREVRE